MSSARVRDERNVIQAGYQRIINRVRLTGLIFGGAASWTAAPPVAAHGAMATSTAGSSIIHSAVSFAPKFKFEAAQIIAWAL